MKTAKYFAEVAKTGLAALEEIINTAMTEAYNQAIEDAAENADTTYPDYLDGNNVVWDVTVDKDSILKLKKSVSDV